MHGLVISGADLYDRYLLLPKASAGSSLSAVNHRVISLT